jgi:transcriptional regulator with XRE-family HTH domain
MLTSDGLRCTIRTVVLEPKADLYSRVGPLIAAKRSARGMSQAALAAAVGLTRTSISNIERGRQKVLLHTFVALAVALSVKPAELLPDYSSSDSRMPDHVFPSTLSPLEKESISAVIHEAVRDS